MNTLQQLKGLGLQLPSLAYLTGALLFGLLGFVAYRHGRRNEHRLVLWLGVALMLFPYVVSTTWALYAVGLALCAGIAVALRMPGRY